MNKPYNHFIYKNNPNADIIALERYIQRLEDKIDELSSKIDRILNLVAEPRQPILIDNESMNTVPDADFSVRWI